MRYTTVYGIVTHVSNATNSKEGNPIKRVNITDPNNANEYEFLIEPDSQLNYRIENSEYADKAHTFYINKNGRLGSMAGS